MHIDRSRSPLASVSCNASSSRPDASQENTRKSAAKDFEVLLATMLVKEMRKTLPEGFFGDHADGDIYGGWFDQFMGKALAQDGSLQLSHKLESAIARKDASTAASSLRSHSAARLDPADLDPTHLDPR